MIHKIDKYIVKRLNEFGWQDTDLVIKSTISKGQISKLKNGSIEKLSAETFYLLVKAFGDEFTTAQNIVYPHLKNNKLKQYKPKDRNVFGLLMRQYENSNNTIEEIAAKTGIQEVRLFELYFRKGGLQAHELLLIEEAIGKKPGDLFEELYGKP
ncbi:transcriptional regulator [Chryseobacterium sp. H3056]|uniref:Transcriptional regulator n=1 Tax=Kaistella daneshvariae TaxID=2487074 RepID=A0A3N0WYA3_9FLAO|nr:transcriptional regulator [Kaistella daneshvariae]ROI10076.1 transcriptional regulator [Kaistella daneshvariae]